MVGVPHPRWVETPLAVVVLAPGADADEADADRALPRAPGRLQEAAAVVFVEVLPRNAAGKVLKRNLRERYRDHVAG